MQNKNSYIRVGVSYYKIVQAPTIAGQVNELLVSWNIETIRQDYGKTFLASIPRYDGFTCIPHHLNFQSTYNNFYNTYSPLSHHILEGSCIESLKFVKHIFGIIMNWVWIISNSYIPNPSRYFLFFAWSPGNVPPVKALF